MKIKCKLPRESAFDVTIDDKTYAFIKQPNGEQVADVDDEAHAARLLSIREAYAVAEPAAATGAGATGAAGKTDNDDADEKADLVAKAKTLGIPARMNWGIAKLQAEISEAEAQAKEVADAAAAAEAAKPAAEPAQGADAAAKPGDSSDAE